MEWMLGFTFRLPARTATPENYPPLKQFMREMMDECRIQVAYISWYSPKPNPHIHLALIFTSKYGTSLEPSHFHQWEKRWNELVRYRTGGLEIHKIYDADGWQAYITNHKDADAVSSFYNRKLLQKHHLGS